MDKRRILVVDDEPSARNGLAKLLQQEGYEVDQAADGVEALASISDKAPGLIISDLKMPNMDGMALLKELQQRRLEIPVIVASAFEELSTAVAPMHAKDYVTKPIDFDALLRIVERAFKREKSRPR